MCCRRPLSWPLHVLFLEPSLSACGGPRSSAWQEIVCACLRLLTSALEPHMQNHTSFSYCTAYASLRKQHKQNRREQNFPIQTRTVVCHCHESHKSSQFLPPNKLLLFCNSHYSPWWFFLNYILFTILQKKAKHVSMFIWVFTVYIIVILFVLPLCWFT